MLRFLLDLFSMSSKMRCVSMFFLDLIFLLLVTSCSYIFISFLKIS